MKKIKFIQVLFVSCLLLLLACEPSLKVTSDYDKSVNFQQYKTFKMVSLDQQHQTISQLNQNRIINAIRNEMMKKGFQESDNPDMVLAAVIILKDMQSVTANTNYYGYGGMYRPYAWGGGMATGYTTYNVQNYKDGSLIIDVADAKTKQLLWEGIGNKEIDKPASDPDKAIADAITSIMANFPPGKTAKK
jgi:hypothetical protein